MIDCLFIALPRWLRPIVYLQVLGGNRIHGRRRLSCADAGAGDRFRGLRHPLT
jgi:hypothetical protein